MPDNTDNGGTGPMPDVAETDVLAVARVDGRDLLTAAASDWSAPISNCPGWDAAQLVGHMGAILAWIDQIVTTGEEVARADRAIPPSAVEDLQSWYLGHLDATIDLLSSTPAGIPTWTFSRRGVHELAWWHRRLAVEIAIHRWDAEQAATAPRPLEAEVAAQGIEEFLDEFLPGLLAKPGIEGLTGTLQLRATDADQDWSVDLDNPPKRDTLSGSCTMVRGSCSDLLLFLTNRQATQLQVDGEPRLVAGWSQLRR
jgi:uncharacterized protein (TIGR03083 family)